PPAVMPWLLRWLLFRLEFGAGLIKIRGDRCWRDLTCLFYHHETQPMLNPLSWYFHRLPRWVHRLEVAGNHVLQLVVPFGLFAPQPVAAAAGLATLLHQSWLILSGNFSWLNWMAVTLAVWAFTDGQLDALPPLRDLEPSTLAPSPGWFQAAALAYAALVAVLSWFPVRNMLSRRQLMNYSFNPLHLVNTYGAFGSITRERYEIAIEGTADDRVGPSTAWREYGFKGKPDDPRRRPPQVAPYHLRLDWLMWFAAMGSPLAHPWLIVLCERLLEGDGPTLKLLRRNPFQGRRPRFVRASLYRYRFTTRAERRATGAWWVRTYVGEYLPPMRLEPRAEARPGT
ncbi:MAG TPA: lipase maturation factor family protein, partial [Actinomycetota bacterium]|nr:lipase maturation factor family protein [Actinomycetota bacterium]